MCRGQRTIPRIPAHEMTKPLPTVGRSIGRAGSKPTPIPPPDTALKDMCQAMSDEDDRQEDRDRHSEIPPAIRGFQAFENRANLQADENESQNVEHENDRLPHRVGRYAYACRIRSGAVRAAVRRSTPSSAPPKDRAVGQHPHAERDDELKNDDRRHVLHTQSVRLKHKPTQHRPRNQTAGHRKQERRRNVANEKPFAATAPTASHHQERARVVQQALAFENGQDRRRAHLTEHGRRGGGVRWATTAPVQAPTTMASRESAYARPPRPRPSSVRPQTQPGR